MGWVGAAEQFDEIERRRDDAADRKHRDRLATLAAAARRERARDHIVDIIPIERTAPHRGKYVRYHVECTCGWRRTCATMGEATGERDWHR